MKVSTSLVVAAVLVALSTSVNAKTASTSVFASEPSDIDPTEELSLSSESTAEQSDKDNSKSLVDTKDATGDPPEDLYDFDAPCASDDGDTKKGLTGEQSEEDSSTPLYDFDAPCEPDGGDTKGGLTDEQSDEDSSTPLYDFSSPSCASDPDQIGGFTDEEKAIWIERHNYFRVAALPWAAGNMKRMNWDDELAKEAASTAESCTAETTAGLNVFKATSTDSSSVIDEALNDWAVKPALSNIGSVVPPAKEGDSVGAGLYNSYTQVIWAETTSVGCAMTSCSGGSMVVCKYSPAGNDGKSPWFVHAAQAKLCPTGTTAVLGLCVVEGDPANKLIAPIPKGKSSLEVYSTFIADIMATILKAAKARDAPGADPVAVVSPDGSVSESTKEPSASDTEASPDPLTDDKTEATGEGKEATSEDLSTSDLSTTTSSLPQKGKSLDMFKDLGESSETSPSTSSGEKSSGTVKPSSESGGDNETPTESTELGDPTKQESAELGDPTKEESAELGDPTKQESAELGDATKQESAELGTSSNSDLKATAMANTQSSIITSNGGGPSPAAIAGIVVAAVVAVAVVAVFISYRKNQQRQRDIMHDGGV